MAALYSYSCPSVCGLVPPCSCVVFRLFACSVPCVRTCLRAVLLFVCSTCPGFFLDIYAPEGRKNFGLMVTFAPFWATGETYRTDPRRDPPFSSELRSVAQGHVSSAVPGPFATRHGSASVCRPLLPLTVLERVRDNMAIRESDGAHFFSVSDSIAQDPTPDVCLRRRNRRNVTAMS